MEKDLEKELAYETRNLIWKVGLAMFFCVNNKYFFKKLLCRW